MDSEVAVQVEARNAWIKGMMKEAPLYEVGHQIFRETDHYRSSLKVWKENHLCVCVIFVQDLDLPKAWQLTGSARIFIGRTLAPTGLKCHGLMELTTRLCSLTILSIPEPSLSTL